METDSRKGILEFWWENSRPVARHSARSSSSSHRRNEAMKTVAAKISENPSNYLIYEPAIVKRNATTCWHPTLNNSRDFRITNRSTSLFSPLQFSRRKIFIRYLSPINNFYNRPPLSPNPSPLIFTSAFSTSTRLVRANRRRTIHNGAIPSPSLPSPHFIL